MRESCRDRGPRGEGRGPCACPYASYRHGRRADGTGTRHCPYSFPSCGYQRSVGTGGRGERGGGLVPVRLAPHASRSSEAELLLPEGQAQGTVPTERYHLSFLDFVCFDSLLYPYEIF